MKLPTIRGEILTSFKQECGKSFELNISIPKNTTAEVYIPQIAENYLLTVDGQNILEPKIESSYIIIDGVESGTHIFRIKRNNKMEIIIGLIFVTLAGFGTGSSAWPFKVIKDIHFEQYLFLACFLPL